MKSQQQDTSVFDGAPETPVLLTPLPIRGLTTRNRIVVSPMCQYCAANGVADDWHLVHLGSRAAGGAGTVFVEATAVSPEGRSPRGSGPLERPADRTARPYRPIYYAHGSRAGHSTRPCGTQSERSALPSKAASAFTNLKRAAGRSSGPSPLPFAEGYQVPRELNENGIHAIVDAFVAAAKRAIKAEFKIIELHFAHGYLIHQFLSPLSNKRTDKYGGSLENRMRLPLDSKQKCDW